MVLKPHDANIDYLYLDELLRINAYYKKREADFNVVKDILITLQLLENHYDPFIFCMCVVLFLIDINLQEIYRRNFTTGN